MHFKGKTYFNSNITAITRKTSVWYRTHESELKNGLYHADNARARLTSCVLQQGKALNVRV